MVLKLGSKGEDVRELQQALKELGYNCGVVDGDFGRATNLQVEKYQEDNDLLPDGIVGNGTLSEINKDLEECGANDLKFEIGDYPDPEEPASKMDWVRVDADQVDRSQGYNRFNLREDAAAAYNAARQEILSLGGVITSSGAKRPLSDSKKMKSRSIKSLHYTGLALDLALDSGMNDPKRERYVIEEQEDRRWNVWCKTDNEQVPVREVTGYTYHHSRVPVKERMFSLTDVFKRHGFEPIRARRYFIAGGNYLGAEWWHFQYEKALTPGVSTFGGELLKIYSIEKCRKFAPWESVKHCVWKESWW